MTDTVLIYSLFVSILDSNQVPLFLDLDPFLNAQGETAISSKWLFVFLVILIDCCHSWLQPPTPLPLPPPPLDSPSPQRVGCGSHTNAECALRAKQRVRPPELLLNVFNEPLCFCFLRHRASLFGVTEAVAGNMSAGL